MTKKSAAVLKTIHELMEKHGLTTADIDGHVGGKLRAKKAGAKTVVKESTATVRYRDPKTGATWTGHGRAPSWIATAKNRDKFLVDASAATVKPAPVSKAKAAGNYVRGPQPAMYKDPKSGATWSGRGPAPAWLAAAKDRTRFLIADAGSADAGSANVAGKRATAKKVVAKKAVATKPAAKNAPAKKTVTAKTAKTASKKVAVKAMKKPAVKKVPTKKASPKSMAVTAPSAVDETSVGLTA